MKTILISGSNGFIATNFIKIFKDKYKFILLSHKKKSGHITIKDLYSDDNLVNSIGVNQRAKLTHGQRPILTHL